MSPQALLEELHRQPFVPIRLYMTDGKTYDILHPDLALVTQREIYVGVKPEPDSGVPMKTDLVSLSHVVRAELLTEPPRPVPVD